VNHFLCARVLFTQMTHSLGVQAHTHASFSVIHGAHGTRTGADLVPDLEVGVSLRSAERRSTSRSAAEGTGVVFGVGSHHPSARNAGRGIKALIADTAPTLIHPISMAYCCCWRR
jgi:hypothetical protein